MGMAPAIRESLTADDWTGAALDALARGGGAACALEGPPHAARDVGGPAAVDVDPLAKELGTTKGSFYWHFADRNALIAAALERWEERDTDLVIEAIDRADDAATRLRNLLHLAFRAVRARAEPGAGSVELALQASATDPLVAATLRRVTSRRRADLSPLFTRVGRLPAPPA